MASDQETSHAAAVNSSCSGEKTDHLLTFECTMCKQSKPAAEIFRRQKKCAPCMDAYFADINAQPETECKWCKVVKPREGGFQKNCIVCTACKANRCNKREERTPLSCCISPVTRKTQGRVRKPKTGHDAPYDALCTALRSKYSADTLGSITVEQDGECRTSKIVPLKFLTAADVQRLVDT